MTSLKVGLIGCGFIAEKHAQTLNKLKEHFQIVALADKDTNQLSKIETLLEDKRHEVATFIDYQTLLASKEVEVVIITSPTGLHSKMIKDALHKGKHVIVEKPLVLSLKEADEIIALSDICERQVLVCHQLRYRPVFRKIKQLLDTDQFGKVYTASASIQINRPKQYYQQASWRGTWEHDGGMLLNQGLHVADLLQWYMGDISSIYGKIENFTPSKETEDVALGSIRFKNGALGSITANSLTKPNNIGYRISLVSEKGTFSISGPSINHVDRFYLDTNSVSDEEIRKIATDQEERLYMYQDFYHTLTKTNPNFITSMDVRAAKEVLEFIFGLYQSHKKQQIIHFPITDFSTVEMRNIIERGCDMND